MVPRMQMGIDQYKKHWSCICSGREIIFGGVQMREVCEDNFVTPKLCKEDWCVSLSEGDNFEKLLEKKILVWYNTHLITSKAVAHWELQPCIYLHLQLKSASLQHLCWNVV